LGAIFSNSCWSENLRTGQDLEYLGASPEAWKIVDDSVILEIKYGTKGEKFADGSTKTDADQTAPYPRTVGPSRTVYVPLDLALDLLEYRNKERLRLISKYIGSAVDSKDRARRQREVKTWHRLFLSDYDCRPVQGSTLLKAFKFNPPYPEWHTHLGRHYFACTFVLRKLRQQWAIENSEHQQARIGPPPDWVLFQGQAALLMLKRQLGHHSEATTEKYLVWLLQAFESNRDDYVAALDHF